MSDIEKFVEEMKTKTLYEKREQGKNLSELIFGSGERQNEKMAQLCMAIENVIKTFPDGYREQFDGFIERIIVLYPVLDGWAVDKAIEAEGKTYQVREDGEKKEKRFLGLF